MPDIPSELRVLVTLGIGLLLILLRLDAERFGAAEYDEAAPDGHGPSVRGRLAWYGLGTALVLAAVFIRPAENLDLGLGTGDRAKAIVGGFAWAALGTAQAVAFALYRYRHLRLPPVSSYPNALINSLVTAFVDEATFRGILLGFLLAAGLQAPVAIVVAALVYALSTRTGAHGRDPYMLGLSLGIGLIGGWLTVVTGGIGAAFLGHAVTRFAVFLCTGHAGRFALRGLEPEEIERSRRTPAGWDAVSARDGSRER
jgi:membrane protease YdiL (CAAX protease family)